MIFGLEPTQMLCVLAVSLGLTLILELAVALVWRLSRRDLLLTLPVNVLTNPATVFLAYLAAYLFPACPRLLLQLPLELIVVVVEGALYQRYADRVRYPYTFSLSANAFSYLIGLLISRIL